MEVTRLCSICGKPGTMITCPVCGRQVGAECFVFERNACVMCAPRMRGRGQRTRERKADEKNLR